MKYEIINPDEDIIVTRELLKSYYKDPLEKWKINAADCRIFMRGKVWIIEHEGDVLYYETHSEAYPFFENAFHYMNVEKRAKWKTLGELITFRNAIREATVQGTDYCERFLEDEDKPLTKDIYKEFLRYARAHDFIHHGSHTF
jgi:hypothetical protein